MKKRIGLVLVAVMMVCALLLAGCQSTAATETKAAETKAAETKAAETKAAETKAAETKAADDEFTVLVLPKMIGIPIFDAFEAGAVKAGEDFGIEVIYTGPTAADATEQVKILEDYINSGKIDCVAVAPNDPDAFTPVLKKAQEAGIMVVDWDTYADKSVVDLSCRQLDDTLFGQAIWDGLVNAMGDSGDYAVITGGLSAENLNTWIDAGMSYAKEKYPNLNLVTDIIPCDEKQQEAYAKAQELIKAYPNLKGIVGISTPAPIGAAQAVQEKELQDKIAVVGTICPNDGNAFLKDGSLDSGYLYDPTNFMYATVYLAWQKYQGVEITDGMEIPNINQKITTEDNGRSITFAPPLEFTEENVDDFDF